MGGLRSRRKGRLGEREIIDVLQPIVDEVYQTVEIPAPKLQRNSLQSDGGGFDVVGLDWIAIECKRCETLGTSAWWKQCVAQAGSAREPVLCYRQNNAAWRVQLYSTLFPDARGQQVVATVDMPTFLAYFRRRLTQRLEERT